MYKILKAELNYHKLSWYSIVLLIPLILLYTGEESESGTHFIIFLFPYLMINTIIPPRYKEKRDRLFTLLPIVNWHIALERIVLIIAVVSLYLISYSALYALIYPNQPSNFNSITLFFGIIIFIYSIFFIINDIFVHTLKHGSDDRGALTKFKGGMIIFIAILMLAGFYALYAKPPGLLIFYNLIAENNPFSGEFGEIKFVFVSLLLAMISVFTFAKRRSYSG